MDDHVRSLKNQSIISWLAKRHKQLLLIGLICTSFAAGISFSGIIFSLMNENSKGLFVFLPMLIGMLILGATLFSAYSISLPQLKNHMNRIAKIVLGIVLIPTTVGVIGSVLHALFPEIAYYILLGGLCGACVVIFLSPIIGKKES